jgi:hypothetical protein
MSAALLVPVFLILMTNDFRLLLKKLVNRHFSIKKKFNLVLRKKIFFNFGQKILSRSFKKVKKYI